MKKEKKKVNTSKDKPKIIKSDCIVKKSVTTPEQQVRAEVVRLEKEKILKISKIIGDILDSQNLALITEHVIKLVPRK